ncbi:MAG: serine protease [Peptococcaceae bacterium]|nr:serine protease [Peptococcaceae bacterium]
MAYVVHLKYKQGKNIWCLLLVLFLLFLLPQGAWAAAEPSYLAEADTLNNMGLFLGTERGYELHRLASRAESSVMLTRLLGKENLAKEINASHPFRDSQAWADPYLGYLYQERLTNGVGKDLFGFGESVTPSQFVTFLLRSLGYQDGEGKDFTYDASLKKGLEVGLYTQEQYDRLQSMEFLTRGYCVHLSYQALFVTLKDSDISLLKKLYLNDGAITGEAILAAAENDEQLAIFAEKELDLTAGSLQLSAGEIYEKASPAVFLIEVFDRKDVLLGTGSGFFIGEDGRFVTNYHVIKNAYSAKVHLTNGKTYPVDVVWGIDEENDLAILQIKTTKKTPYLTIGNSDLVENGDKVYALGSPKGHMNTLTEGLVTNRHQLVNKKVMLQMTAPIAAGSSGGALLNERGQVIGVTTSGLRDDKNVGFAVAANHIAEVPLTDGESLAYLFNEHHLEALSSDEEGNYYEQEPNDTRGNANVYPADEMMIGAIDTPNDVDMFRISVTEKTYIAVGLTCGSDWFTKNLVLMLIDDEENIIALSDAETINNSCMQTLYGTMEKGDYYLALMQNGPKDKDALWYDVPYYMIYYYN